MAKVAARRNCAPIISTVDVISVVQLGTVDYASGLRLQQKLLELRKAGQIGDVLLLLEHTPVITLGRNAKAANVLAAPEELTRRGVEMFECDRGGDVTFHGPGQLVGYPVFDLRGFPGSVQQSAFSTQHSVSSLRSAVRSQPDPDREEDALDRSRPDAISAEETVSASDANSPGVKRKTLGAVDYVRRLEEVLIRTCADFRIPTKRVAGLTGVWTDSECGGTGLRPGPGGAEPSPHAEIGAVEPRSAGQPRAVVPTQVQEAKIAAIGVHISRSVTSHGFALNVITDLSFFNLIVPCGITAKPVTSMQKELGREVEMTAVAESVSRNFGSVFGRQMLWVETLDALLGNTIGVPMKVPAELRSLRGEDDLLAT